MREDHFGPEVAASYDESVGDMSDPDLIASTVDFLAGLAGDGRALEFAIGTGRVALPLAARGVAVSGIELSQAMAERLRSKPGGQDIPVTMGDIASTRVEGGFRLVYLVFNTIGNLTSQDEQVACFANAAAHLEPGGRFVIEVGVPALRSLPAGQRYVVFDGGGDHWGVDEYDTVPQSLISHHFVRDGDAFRRTSTPLRYVWPAELDLMARFAGMTLESRWAGWQRQPFDHESGSHVSVWRKP